MDAAGSVSTEDGAKGDGTFPADAAAELPEKGAKDAVECTVTVNGETVKMTGRASYMFVDIFDWITFDLKAGDGKEIITLVNGENAEYSQKLQNGDKIELYWKENELC